jgi:GNAT superfamily N-acetyltransferase
MASFWSENSSAPSWISFVKNWWSDNSQPKILDTSVAQLKIQPVPGCIVRKATPHDLECIPEFLNRYFSITSRCKCYLPVQRLKEADWEIYVCITNAGVLVGTIVRRWIYGLHIGLAQWQKGGMIDYFCVHPAWRKRGIGRWLLATVQNTAPKPTPPHLILWEGLKPTTPPLLTGFYWSRRCLPTSTKQTQQLPFTPSLWSETVRNKFIYSDPPTKSQTEISFWKTEKGNVTIWNTYHKTVPDGLLLGIVLSGSVDSVNEFVSLQKNPWGYLLVSSTNPFYSEYGSEWSIDSPFQWIAYNLTCASVKFGEFPSLAL